MNLNTEFDDTYFWQLILFEFKFVYHENINKPLDSAYLADFGIDITKMIGLG